MSNIILIVIMKNNKSSLVHSFIHSKAVHLNLPGFQSPCLAGGLRCSCPSKEEGNEDDIFEFHMAEAGVRKDF
jgi:hypothetical protein